MAVSLIRFAPRRVACPTYFSVFGTCAHVTVDVSFDAGESRKELAEGSLLVDGSCERSK